MTDIPYIRRSPLEHEHCLPAPAAPQVSVMDDPKVVERVAAALWKAQVVDAGSPKSAIDRRTPEAFAESGDDARGKWLKMARAALEAIAPISMTTEGKDND